MLLDNVFLVGGSIRDKLLLINFIEFDWLIIRVESKILINNGFKKVGKDFPVFLHPLNKEEYALARKEKKVGKGYYGFKCDFSIYVSLAEDLFRRDLTINSLALDCYGNLIDYFYSKNDLIKKKFINVSFAFFEDPLRIFRVFRFFIKYFEKNFFLSSYLNSFIIKIILSAEFLELSIDRILKEINLSLRYKNCFLFINFLYKNNILNFLFYDLNEMINISFFYYYNFYLNFNNQLNLLFINIYIYINNVFIKFLLFFYKINFKLICCKNFNKNYFYNRKNFILFNKYIKIFNMSKKNYYFLINLKFFNFFLDNNLLIGNYYLYLFFHKINAFKDKIKIINYILIVDLDLKINYTIYNFHYKYLFFDLLDNLLVLKSLMKINYIYFNSSFLRNKIFIIRNYYNKYYF